MREREIRPVGTGADRLARTTTNLSEHRKFCTQCKTWKSMDDMAPDRRNKDGRRSVCTRCRKTYDRARYAAKPDAILSQQRGYRQANRGVRWLADYQKRVEKYGLEPVGELVTPEAIVDFWGDRCFYNSEHAFEEPDHFIAVAAGGHHVLDNLVPCCKSCNRKKRWEVDEPAIRLVRDSRAAVKNGPSEALRRT